MDGQACLHSHADTRRATVSERCDTPGGQPHGRASLLAQPCGYPTGNGAERTVDVRLAPTVAERRPASGISRLRRAPGTRQRRKTQ